MKILIITRVKKRVLAMDRYKSHAAEAELQHWDYGKAYAKNSISAAGV